MFAVTKEYVEHNIIADIDKVQFLVPNKKIITYLQLTDSKDIRQLLET